MAIRVRIPDGDDRWPDVEKAMVTLLDDLLSELEPAGYACVLPPSNYDELIDQGVAIVTVQRAGGTAERINEDASVFLTVTTGYRSDSWDVLGWLRPKLHQVNDTIVNGDGTVALITKITDARGPQKDPGLSEDSRRVGAGFTVTTRIGR